MCLVTTSLQPFVAEKDIEVYKYLLVKENGELCAPFHANFKYIPNKIYKAKGIAEYEYPYLYMEGDPVQIMGGWLYSTIESNSVLSLNEDIVCYKAIIPKGSLYYRGIYDTYDQFTSNKLIILPQNDTLKCKVLRFFRRLFNIHISC